MIKTWTGTHPEEVTAKANAALRGCEILHICTVKNEREFILTVVYEEAEKPNKTVMRCG